jgi:hypothetical protein
MAWFPAGDALFFKTCISNYEVPRFGSESGCSGMMTYPATVNHALPPTAGVSASRKGWGSPRHITGVAEA